MSKISELTHPLRLIKGLENTPQYKSQLTSGNRKRAMGSTARYFAEKMAQKEQRSDQERLDEFAVSLIAALPSFVEGSRQLDAVSVREDMMGKKVSRSEKLPHLEKVVPFNHVLRELIDNFSASTPDNIVDFCTVVGAELGGPKDASYIEQEVRERLVGMQHEIALEQILWNIDGVEDVLQGDIDDDIDGCDAKVIFRGLEIRLDAKAGEQRYKNALADREYYRQSKRLSESDMSEQGYPIFSGVTNSDFNGGFRINQTAIERCTPDVEAVLSYLYEARVNKSLQA